MRSSLESEHTQPTILLVEDERPLLRVIKTILEKEGYAVVTAQSGEEGLSLMSNTQPAIIVADVLMPGLGGVGMLKEVRQTLWGQHTPVIFYSNLNPAEIMPEASAYGAVYCLQKSDPRSMDHLLQIIQDELSPGA